MSASYPTSVKTFSNRNTGDVIQPSHVNDVQDEVNAIEAGLLTGPLTIGGQILFPATQAPSANANTLDDYEEGSWTPVLGGLGGTSGQTYSGQVGRYVKIGQLVTCFGSLNLTAKGTITSTLQIQGLPFMSNATDYGTITFGSWSNLNTAVVHLYGYVAPGGTVADIRGAAAAVTDSGQPDTSYVTNTTALIFTVTYRAAA